MTRSDGLWLVAVLASLSACRREVAPPPDASAPPAAVPAAVPSPPATAALPSAPVATPTRALGEVDTWVFPVAGKRLTLIVPRAGETAVLIDPAMGEWSSMMVIRDADSVTVSDVPGVLTLTYASGKTEGTLTLGSTAGVRVPLKAHPSESAPSSPSVVPTLAGDAVEPRVLGRHGSVVLAWSEGFLPAFPSLPAPRRLQLGAATVTPVLVAPAKVEGCVVRGTRPAAAAPPLEEALRAAFDGATTAACKASGGQAILEASYSLVRFSGMNQLDGDRAPGPTDVIAMTLVHRVTTDKGSTIAEAGYLVGLAKAEVVPLRSLLAPGGAAWLSREARAIADLPMGLPPSLVVDASRGALSVGPSTVDVVIDTLPYGLFLRSRRIAIGPRSATAAAFVGGPLTQRMLAMVNVDY